MNVQYLIVTLVARFLGNCGRTWMDFRFEQYEDQSVSVACLSNHNNSHELIKQGGSNMCTRIATQETMVVIMYVSNKWNGYGPNLQHSCSTMIAQLHKLNVTCSQTLHVSE
jgi:hypothetical protein